MLKYANYLSLGKVQGNRNFVSSQPRQIIGVKEFPLELPDLELRESRSLLPRPRICL